jgi:hypothetical protein
LVPSRGWDVVYLRLDAVYLPAAEALNLDLNTVRSITDETPAGSARANPGLHLYSYLFTINIG